MSESKSTEQENQLTREEHEQIFSTYNELTECKIKFADISLELYNLKKEKIKLQSNMEALMSKTIDMQDRIFFKYGDVEVDLNTGIFKKV